MNTEETTAPVVTEAPAPKVQLTISMILQHLKDGMTRDQIGEKYGLNKAQVKILFRHPKLKFKKTILPKDLPFELTDDTEEPIPQNEPVAAKKVTDFKELAMEDAHSQKGVDIVDDTKAEKKSAW